MGTTSSFLFALANIISACYVSRAVTIFDSVFAVFFIHEAISNNFFLIFSRTIDKAPKYVIVVVVDIVQLSGTEYAI